VPDVLTAATVLPEGGPAGETLHLAGTALDDEIGATRAG
jgi:hypothetical protein